MSANGDGIGAEHGNGPKMSIVDALSVPGGTYHVKVETLESWVASRVDALTELKALVLSLSAAGDQHELERLAEKLDKLPPRERVILRSRLGLDGVKKTLTALAAEFGVGRERIRQLEFKAACQLRDADDDDEQRRMTVAGGLFMLTAQYYAQPRELRAALKTLALSSLAGSVVMLIDSLPPRRRDVIRGRLGLDGAEKSVKDLAAELGVCEASIRHIESKALDWLRAAMQARPPTIEEIEHAR
jgi:DNA-directed RNA polymerase sigma subunit (sigma70/sigma32)